MASMRKLVLIPLSAALAFAAVSAEAVRPGFARFMGARATESTNATDAAAGAATGAAAAGGNVASPQSALARAITGADVKEAVVNRLATASANAAARNAAADSVADSAPGQPVAVYGTLTPVSYQVKGPSTDRPSKNADLDRERAAEALAVRMFDQSAVKAQEQMDRPPEKTAAEIAREKKEAAVKAEAKRADDERKMKLAREQSCRIEPVMSDRAIANCRKVFREPT